MTMKHATIYISVDMEGVAGVVSWEHTGKEGGHEFDRARKLMTGEVNAAIEGAFAGAGDGVELTVIVNDAHGGMRNLLLEELDPRAMLISGGPKRLGMMEGINASVSAAILVGYHSMASSRGVLAHSYYPGLVQLEYAGTPIGELALSAYSAGYFGVPVIAVTGDDEVAKEATGLIPGVETITVKWTAGRLAATCLSPARSRERIASGVKRAVMGHLLSPKVAPLVPGRPSSFRLRFANASMADAAALLPGSVREDPLTVSYVHEDYLEALRGARVMMAIAASIPGDPY
ncbi:MAG TPA: M55 family metallopeptidase [Firmicutes bacterium]|nr:M55 family metallopeptidase [Bacillota bacterium]